MERPVLTHERPSIGEEIKERSKTDFFKMIAAQIKRVKRIHSRLVSQPVGFFAF